MSGSLHAHRKIFVTQLCFQLNCLTLKQVLVAHFHLGQEGVVHLLLAVENN